MRREDGAQVKALNPTTFSYIVGKITIDFSRMIERALPGQVLLGDFGIEVGDAKINIHRVQALPIYLGLSSESLAEFPASGVDGLDRGVPV